MAEKVQYIFYSVRPTLQFGQKKCTTNANKTNPIGLSRVHSSTCKVPLLLQLQTGNSPKINLVNIMMMLQNLFQIGSHLQKKINTVANDYINVSFTTQIR